MKKFNFLTLICLASFFISRLASAEALQGNYENGKKLSITCSACHGEDGNSIADIYPKLANQNPNYIYKQLKDFKLAGQTSGSEGRNNAIMIGYVADLSDQDMLDLSAYYAMQKITPNYASLESIEQARHLYQGGSIERGIPACMACHGPKGDGVNSANFPQVAGQNPAYLKDQLVNFKSDERANDMNHMMRDIAKKLDVEEMEYLAQYMSSLH